ncbi:MAG TPA: hypothetical protein PLX54_08005 [Candidatus Fermentibacter daniensis]|nr:hypothetical protein [Candidatus Fermentibacter daniensis]HOR07089.1 hypothetical protein [Candidatus Fermentibacter daniensis]HPK52298.1 hypothetical protein [Candidatus Fermentibacter daniensis]
MKREANLLLEKASDSLVLAIELFNRPNDRGRVSSTLIQLDHAFEMLMKAAIVHRGGRIREKRAKETIGFDACVRRSLSDGKIKYLSEEQALVVQTINGLRDAAQHHLLDISEGQLYVHVQSGVTLFRDLLKSVFDQDLACHLPERVLPVSTSPPTDLATLFDSEVKEIEKLLQPGRRRRLEALARLRPLAILDATIRGEKGQPSDSDLQRIGDQFSHGKAWADVFQGAAAVEIAADGAGPSLSLRLSKKEGIPIQLVAEGTPGAAVVAVKRVNELDFYSLGAKQLAEKVGLTMPKVVAVVDHLGLREDEEYYKEFRIGSQTHKRYSPKSIVRIKEALKLENLTDIWEKRSMKAK